MQNNSPFELARAEWLRALFRDHAGAGLL
jgi:hypothetical protein